MGYVGHIKFSRVYMPDFSKFDLPLFLRIDLIAAKSEDPDEITCYVVLHLGLY